MSFHNPTDELLLIDNRNNLTVFHFEEAGTIRFTTAFTLSGFVQEASDIVIHNRTYLITDYKAHAVVVFNFNGNNLLKIF